MYYESLKPRKSILLPFYLFIICFRRHADEEAGVKEAMIALRAPGNNVMSTPLKS